LYIQTASAIITNVRNPYPAITTGQFIGYIGSDQAFPNGGASINLVAGNLIIIKQLFHNALLVLVMEGM
jgi:hypothetical protein